MEFNLNVTSLKTGNIQDIRKCVNNVFWVLFIDFQNSEKHVVKVSELPGITMSCNMNLIASFL